MISLGLMKGSHFYWQHLATTKGWKELWTAVRTGIPVAQRSVTAQFPSARLRDPLCSALPQTHGHGILPHSVLCTNQYCGSLWGDVLMGARGSRMWEVHKHLLMLWVLLLEHKTPSMPATASPSQLQVSRWAAQRHPQLLQTQLSWVPHEHTFFTSSPPTSCLAGETLRPFWGAIPGNLMP